AETVAPKAAEPPAKTADVPLRLDAVDYNDKGDIIFSGRAKPGTAVRLYVDNGSVGDAVVDSAGNWSFAGNDIIAPGTHMLRADQIDGSGKVMARIELPFQREDAAAVAALNAPAQPEPQPAPQPEATQAQPVPQPTQPETTQAESAPQPAQPEKTEAQPTAPQTAEVAKAEPEPVTPAPSAPQPATEQQPAEQPSTGQQPAESQAPEKTEEVAAAPQPEPEAKPAEPDKPRSGKVVIQPGNNLWKLSRVIYGRGINFTVIYDANKEQIRDPDLIYPGQIFAIPNATPPESIDPKRREPLTSAEGGAAQ
ncbi:MAG TPA: LysM peptidoglycan-binding domain-containing protein, partial [Nordella sp.]|nr:LysM peptidoglycan-binding domain-containing protein [Nordella sp.]